MSDAPAPRARPAHLGWRLLAMVYDLWPVLALWLLPIGLPISISIGLAVHRAGEAPGETLRRADAALYQAKAQGRNRVVLEMSEV